MKNKKKNKKKQVKKNKAGNIEKNNNKTNIIETQKKSGGSSSLIPFVSSSSSGSSPLIPVLSLASSSSSLPQPLSITTSTSNLLPTGDKAEYTIDEFIKEGDDEIKQQGINKDNKSDSGYYSFFEFAKNMETNLKIEKNECLTLFFNLVRDKKIKRDILFKNLYIVVKNKENSIIDKLKKLEKVDKDLDNLSINLEAKTAENFDILKINLGKLQIKILLKMIEKSKDCNDTINKFISLFGDKIETVNTILDESLQMGGGNNTNIKKTQVKNDNNYYKKYIKYKLKYILYKKNYSI